MILRFFTPLFFPIWMLSGLWKSFWKLNPFSWVEKKKKIHAWINLVPWGRKGLWLSSVSILHVYGSVVSEPVSILDNDVPWFTHSIFSCHLTSLSFSLLQPLTCISSCFSFVMTKTSCLPTWSLALICNTFSVLHVSSSFYFSRKLPPIHLSFHTSSPFGR